jgi:1-acyl-sn-glycerol-3-phosphate acyltransferase
VGVFPEGTRSKDGAIGPFKPGAFRLAIETGRPIVPVVLSGIADVLPKGSMLFEGSADVRIRVLEPIPTAGLGPQQAASLAEDVRTRMARALDG